MIEVHTFRICDRCYETGVENEAEVTDKWVLSGHRFEADLCAEHSAELYMLLMHTWGDSAIKTGEPTIFDKQIRLSTASPVAVEPKPAPEQPLKLVKAKPELPHSAQRWTLTTHAEEQMCERGFTLYDVLMACERSQTVVPTQHHMLGRMGPDAQLRRHDECLVAVDARTFSVLTVMVAGESKHSWNRKQQQQKAEV